MQTNQETVTPANRKARRADGKKAKAKTARKARAGRGGGPTNISVAREMFTKGRGATMAEVEKATGDTQYAALRALEEDGYTIDRSKHDKETNRIVYKATKKVNLKKAA